MHFQLALFFSPTLPWASSHWGEVPVLPCRTWEQRQTAAMAMTLGLTSRYSHSSPAGLGEGIPRNGNIGDKFVGDKSSPSFPASFPLPEPCCPATQLRC